MPGVLGDDRGAVGGDLGDGEPGVVAAVDPRNLGEEREVAAGGLGAAFDDVARGDGTGECVVVRAGPAEVGGGRADDHRGVGDAAGDDDIGPGVQAFDDAPGTEVGVGGQQGHIPGRNAAARRCPESEFVGPRDEVVTLDMGHVHGQSEAVGELAYRGGKRARVQPAGVGDDLHALVQGESERVLQLAQEGLGIAELRILGPVAGQDQHGQFGQVVAGEVVEVTAFEHLPHGRDAVTVEPRAVADAHCCRLH